MNMSAESVVIPAWLSPNPIWQKHRLKKLNDPLTMDTLVYSINSSKTCHGEPLERPHFPCTKGCINSTRQTLVDQNLQNIYTRIPQTSPLRTRRWWWLDKPYINGCSINLLQSTETQTEQDSFFRANETLEGMNYPRLFHSSWGQDFWWFIAILLWLWMNYRVHMILCLSLWRMILSRLTFKTFFWFGTILDEW